MRLKGLTGGQYKPLSPNQIEKIHKSAFEILERTGFTYEGGVEEALELLEKNGATVDRKTARIYLPQKMVTEAVSKASSNFVLYGRDPKNHVDLGEDRVHLGTGGFAVKVLDLHSGQARPTTLKDVYDIGRLVDRLDNIHFCNKTCLPHDVPQKDNDINVIYSYLCSTTKHIMGGVDTEETFDAVLDLCAMVAGGRDKFVEAPFFTVTTCFAISPLKLCTQSTRIMLKAVKNGVPVTLSSAPMAGSTSPITMAGTLAMLHAEQLCGITICQLAEPGARVLYGAIPGMADMASMGYVGGGVECGMMNAAIHQMSRHIGVPNYNSSGLSDAKIPDAQAGWEKGMTTLLTAMGGSNYVHHAAGMLESMLGISYEQYVIDDEIIGMSMKVLKGLEVDDEHLALKVIHEVGPGGQYITSPHTLKHLRSEYFMGNGVTDRNNRETWANKGAKDARQRAREIVLKILAEPPRSYISEELDKKIRAKYQIHLDSSCIG